MTVHSRINVYNQPPARTRGSRFMALHRREWYFNRMFEGLLFSKGKVIDVVGLSNFFDIDNFKEYFVSL